MESSLSGGDSLDREVQALVTEYGYGAVWSRRGLPSATRSMLTLALLAALNRPEQLRGHLNGARNLGVTRREMIEIFIHVMLYCGAPAALSAVKIAMDAFSDWDEEAKSAAAPPAAPRRRARVPKAAGGRARLKTKESKARR